MVAEGQEVVLSVLSDRSTVRTPQTVSRSPVPLNTFVPDDDPLGVAPKLCLGSRPRGTQVGKGFSWVGCLRRVTRTGLIWDMEVRRFQDLRRSGESRVGPSDVLTVSEGGEEVSHCTTRVGTPYVSRRLALQGLFGVRDQWEKEEEWEPGWTQNEVSLF